VLGFLLLTLRSPAQAQLSCDNPFEGQIVPFSRQHWDLTDFCQHTVPFSEIFDAGPSRDTIPPIDNPMFVSADAASAWLRPQSPVIAIEVGGLARAYPLEIMIWHEIVNDVIADIPVVITYCPLCNSALVFDRRVGDDVLRFGTTGKLRNSDLIMWDDKTQSWWQQFTGDAIVGAYSGTQLAFIPSQMVSFGAFAEQFPDGEILSRNTGAIREYGINPYLEYDNKERPPGFLAEIDERLPATERVLAGIVDGEPIAYPFTLLAEQQVVNDIIGTKPVVAIWQPGVASALDEADINTSRDIGMAALYSRAVEDAILTFWVDEEANIRDMETGSTWNIFGEAIAGDLAGTQLRPLLAAPHFWFAWAGFQPQTAVYGQ